MSRLLLVVVRDEPRRFEYFRHTYGNDTVEVIVDRRVAERRHTDRPVGTDRRGAARRNRDLTTDLKTFGWALIRH